MVGYRKLLERGFFTEADKVVLFNTGSGLKYLDVIDGYSRSARPQPASRQIGGIIGPY
jgi:threonine synthase